MKSLSKLILAVALVCSSYAVPLKRSKFECPHPDEIYPCTCSSFPRKIVRCNDVKNLEIVQSVLEHRFNNPLPTLSISNMQTFQIPQHAFENVLATKIIVNGSNIRRIHDDAFLGQDALGILILSDDRLAEFPIEAIKRLPFLISLSLAGNFILKITDQSFTESRQLKSLILSENLISSIERNSFPRTLDSLNLVGNLIYNLNGTLIHLNNLEYLWLGNNRLQDIKGELKGITQLKHLSLESNDIVDIVGNFDDLLNLKFLNLANNKLEEIENGLRHLKSLRTLNISNNYITKIKGDFFESLNGLVTLDLSGNYLKNICKLLSPLKDMKVLSLSNSNLKSIDDDCFKEMRYLQSLDLSGNELKNIDAVTSHPFPKLLTLKLQSNRLEMFKHGLKNVRNLIELDISYNNFSTIRRQYFAHNVRVQQLRIAGNSWDCSDHLFQIFQELKEKAVEIFGAPICYLRKFAA
ncbi:hypothetical protein CEXT_432511 [Caerostris extrusa]|uniref:Uncharacterized protein n=1 Tax=Caerostris extrusa TaxID=172846 RepID=A0AAV4TRA7_CAEEX|nr:hypothetical protein CEXT_432511 [Caerostris extrusa]